MTEQRLRLIERDEQCCVRRARSLERDDVPNACGNGVGARVEHDPRTGVDPEVARSPGVEVDLSGAEVGEGKLLSAGASDRREPVHAGGVGREHDDARLVLALRRRLHRDLLHDRPGDAVHEIRALGCTLDVDDDGFVHPTRSGRGTELAGDVVDGALRRDRLVGRAERRDRRRADRMSHGVARGESGGDDRGAEHEPDHDERTAPAPAADAADGELHEDRIAETERRERTECDAERHEKTDEE